MSNLLLERRNEIVSAVEDHNVVAVSGCPEINAASYIAYFLYKAGFTESGPCKKNPPRICVAYNKKSEAFSNSEACSVLIANSSKVTCFTGLEQNKEESAHVIFTTEDCLLRKVIVDPLLSEYGVVVLTGLEQRLLSTEVLVSLLKRIIAKRSRLRVVLCFCGGNVREICAFFKRKAKVTPYDMQSKSDPDELSKPILANLHKLKDIHHVQLFDAPLSYDVQYLSSPSPNYLDTVVSTVCHICKYEPTGNVLIYFPSDVEMEMLYRNLVESARMFRDHGAGSVNIIPIEDEAAFNNARKRNPHESRNIYICTDLKGYSTKVDNVSYVIDCGFSRRMVSDYVNTGAVRCTVHATRDEMQQRARMIRGKGTCYRLMTEETFHDNFVVTEFAQSEIKTNDLTNTLIYMKALGISNFSDFEFFVEPPIHAIEHALTTLFLLGAVDRDGEIVYPIGHIMAELRYTTMLSSFLYRSTELGCSQEALTICAMLEVQDRVMKRPNLKPFHQSEKLQAAMHGFAASEGDLVSYFNVYQLSLYYRDEDARWLSRHMVSDAGIRLAEKVRSRLIALLRKYQLPLSTCGENVELVMQAVMKSFFLNVACKEHLIKTIITSRHLDVEVKVNTKVLDEEGNAILTNELQPYLLVPSIETEKIRRLYIHPCSFLANEQPDWVVFNESIDVDGELFMKDVTAIKPEYLQQYASHYYGEHKVQPYLSC